MSAARNVYELDSVLSPEAKESLRHLEVYARRTVEGLLHGIHRSRHIGVSTEFDHHKNYQPGDPLKHIDWKISARHDRYYVKRYLEDTSLSVRLVVDRSASMRQATENLPSKYLQASRIAACLGYMILKQKDSVGMVLASSEKLFWLPASGAHTHLVRMLEALVSSPPSAGDNLETCLKAILDRGGRKGLIVIISDMMYDPAGVQRQLGRLQAQGNEVLLFQIRDPMEEDFPFNRWVQFHDLEDAAVRHRIDTVPLKKIYREEYEAIVEEWRAWAKKYDAHFVSFRSDERVETILSEYAAFRSGMLGR